MIVFWQSKYHRLQVRTLFVIVLQAKMVDLSLLSASEVNWLNDYHSQVWVKVNVTTTW